MRVWILIQPNYCVSKANFLKASENRDYSKIVIYNIKNNSCLLYKSSKSVLKTIPVVLVKTMHKMALKQANQRARFSNQTAQLQKLFNTNL